jgi:hypothetical protein
MVIPRLQPIRSAMTVVGIRGCSDNGRRISVSNRSTAEGRGWRLNTGGETERTADRTVFLDTPNCRTISLIDKPSARYSRRISAQSSTFSTSFLPGPQPRQDPVATTRSGGYPTQRVRSEASIRGQY